MFLSTNGQQKYQDECFTPKKRLLRSPTKTQRHGGKENQDVSTLPLKKTSASSSKPQKLRYSLTVADIVRLATSLVSGMARKKQGNYQDHAIQQVRQSEVRVILRSLIEGKISH